MKIQQKRKQKFSEPFYNNEFSLKPEPNLMRVLTIKSYAENIR